MELLVLISAFLCLGSTDVVELETGQVIVDGLNKTSHLSEDGTYVLTTKNKVMHFDPSGRSIISFGRAGQGPDGFSRITIAIWFEGHYWVSDLFAWQIKVFNASGENVNSIRDQVWLSPVVNTNEGRYYGRIRTRNATMSGMKASELAVSEMAIGIDGIDVTEQFFEYSNLLKTVKNFKVICVFDDRDLGSLAVTGAEPYLYTSTDRKEWDKVLLEMPFSWVDETKFDEALQKRALPAYYDEITRIITGYGYDGSVALQVYQPDQGMGVQVFDMSGSPMCPVIALGERDMLLGYRAKRVHILRVEEGDIADRFTVELHSI